MSHGSTAHEWQSQQKGVYGHVDSDERSGVVVVRVGILLNLLPLQVLLLVIQILPLAS